MYGSEGGAFSGNIYLTRVTIPKSVPGVGGLAFAACSSLAGIYCEGSPSSLDPFGAFTPDSITTVYFLPGTTGWETTFGYRPTEVSKLFVEMNASSFGVQANQFGFTTTWASDKVVVVDTCTNLAIPRWIPVGTRTLTDGSA